MDMAAIKPGVLEVRLEQLIPAPVEKVWKIVSTTEGMQKWLGPKTWEPQVGGRVLFDVSHDGTRWLMFGSVQELAEHDRVSFTWQEFDTATLACWPAPTLVTLTLEARDGGCLVRLLHSGFDALPNAEAEHAGYQQGWTSRNVLELLAQQAMQE